MTGHKQMTDNQVTVRACPKQVFPHHADVIGDFCQPLRAGVIAKFKIRQPDVEHAVEQFARLRRAVRVGFLD